MTTTRALTVLPDTRRDIDAVAERCRKLVGKRALVSAGAAVVPIPGIDIAVDFGVMAQMLEEINTAFGLTPEQIERLAPKRRLSAVKAVTALGSTAVGRHITRQLVLALAKAAAGRMLAKTSVKYVPLAGQAIAAGMSYAVIRYIGKQHIADCMHVANVVIEAEKTGRSTGKRTEDE
ncbi:MAG TPA: hypothetical protein VFR86_23475 [Burkholderiaceae bacterium]|nr:hypothetical protein [Burkholderiaceae bacterium]